MRRHHDRRAREVTLELIEGGVGLRGPFEGPLSFQDLEEGQGPLAKLGDETTQRGNTPRQLLHPLEGCGCAHLVYGIHLHWVYLDPPVRYQETEQLARWDPEDALLRVEPDLVFAQIGKRLPQVVEEAEVLLRLDDDVIHIDVDVSADLW